MEPVIDSYKAVIKFIAFFILILSINQKTDRFMIE